MNHACCIPTVNVGQVKTELSKLIALALAGEDVEIAKDGVPVVRLVTLEPTRPGPTVPCRPGVFDG